MYLLIHKCFEDVGTDIENNADDSFTLINTLMDIVMQFFENKFRTLTSVLIRLSCHGIIFPYKNTKSVLWYIALRQAIIN